MLMLAAPATVPCAETAVPSWTYLDAPMEPAAAAAGCEMRGGRDRHLGKN